MKKLATLIIAILTVSIGFGQSMKIKKKSDYGEFRPIDPSSFLNQNDSEISTGSTSGLPVGSTISSETVTAIKIGESSNLYTFLVNETNQVSVVPGIGADSAAIGFLYRESFGQCGLNSGIYRYSLSLDNGTTWDTGLGTPAGGCWGVGPLNPTFTQASRYPNLNLFLTPGSSGTSSDLNLVYTGPTLDAANNWDGVIHGTATNVGGGLGTFAVSQESYPYQGGIQYFTYSLVERVPGEFWYAAWTTQDGTTALNDSILLRKGIYNTGTQQVDWTVEPSLIPNYNLSYDGTNQSAFSLNIAFSPDGMTGYVGILADLVGGIDTTLSPCWAKTTNGGSSWGAFEEFDMSQFSQLSDSLQSFWVSLNTSNGDTVAFGAGIATTGFSFDLAVDKFGNPHLVAVVGNSSIWIDSSYVERAYSIYSGARMFIYDFTLDQNGNPNMLFLGPQVEFRGTFGDQTIGGSSDTDADPWMQASRSPDGGKVFFSWTDTDSTGGGNDGNNQPNLITGAFDVENWMTGPTTNWTANDPIWTTRAIMPKISPVAIYDDVSSYKIPTVIADIGPTGTDITLPVSFYFLSDIDYDQSDFNLAPLFFSNCGTTVFNHSSTVVNSACGNSTGTATAVPAGGTAPYIFQWDAAAGSVTTAQATSLAAGSYTVTITDDNGCSEDLTVLVADADGAVLALDSVANVSCFGLNDGVLTVGATSAVGIASYAWDNGQTVATAIGLAPGTYMCTVTDNNGCISFISGSIDEPTELTGSASGTDIDCFGDLNGTATATAAGGTGMLSYSWDSGQTDAALTGLAGGTYVVTVTDENGCNIMNTVVVTQPDSLALALISTDNTSADTPNGEVGVSKTGGTGTVTYAWTGNDTTFTGESFLGLYPGTYVVTATDANGCVTVDSVVVGGILSSVDPLLNAGIGQMDIYPNPSTGNFTLSLNMLDRDDLTIEVISLNGQVLAGTKVANTSFHEEKFNLNTAAGIYLIKVTTSNGSATQKVIIR